MKKIMLGGLLLAAGAVVAGALLCGLPLQDVDTASAQEAEEPAKPEAEESGEEGKLEPVPDGNLTETGLEFIVPFERGDGKLVLSRQNEMLRLDALVRLPYSAGDASQTRGSSLNVSLSVDGNHGRHLFYFPDPIWAPDGQGRFPTYRWEASFEKGGQIARLNTEPSFAGTHNIKHWAQWEATLWIDLRYVLIPGNSPTELAETWRMNIVAGNAAATVVYPSGVDLQNPAKTADRMLTFKYSELPERDELDDDPREQGIEAEESHHEHMKGIEAELMTGNLSGAFGRIEKAIEEYPDSLWPRFLAYRLSFMADQRGLDDITTDYVGLEKDYVDACPGQSSAHLQYLSDLLQHGETEAAFAHAKTIFESPMCTEREATDGYMHLEWAKRLIEWGFADEASQILTAISENKALLEKTNFRIDYKFQLAALAERRSNSEKAAEIYEGLLVEETKNLNGDQMQTLQALLQFQKEAVEAWKTELEHLENDATKKNPRLVVETTKGKIVIELFEDDAPNTVASLVKLAKNEFYNGLNFHRVVPGFVAQGGCPNGDGSGGPGYRLKFEDNDRNHFRGTLSMARAQHKDSAGCQFFICLSNGPNVINLNDNYTVVGRVTEGMDVADKLRVGDKIVSVTAENLRDHEYDPETLPEMK